jgi:hypothetical protein
LLADVDGEGYGRIHACVEGIHVLIEFGLIDLAISLSDEVEKVLHDDSVETFVGIIKFSIVDCFDGGGDEVDGDA